MSKLLIENEKQGNLNMKTQLIALGILTGISGCTVNSNDDFTCPNPEKGICMPAQEAYVHAEAGRTAESISRSRKLSNQDDGSSEPANGSKYTDVAPVAGLMTLPLSQPKPILEPAKVLKAWVNFWEDDSNILHMPQVAYVEITPRRWNAVSSNIHKFKSSNPFKRIQKNSE